MRHLILIFAASFCIAAACNKEHLPEYYFECKLDGKEYVPDNCANCRRSIILGDTVLLINANRGFEVIGFGIVDQPIEKTTYLLNHERTKHSADYDNTIGNPSDIFRTDSIRIGQLTITSLDKVNKIIAGSFSFVAYNVEQNKTVNVTEGKFRLQYKIN
ncbi:MAG: hypothetical protein H0V30_02785 [Chitinophagaceae bacterium]|jgi:hypothetical protein|nr:hypothetical protein [Chitinophagaceae bacterium]